MPAELPPFVAQTTRHLPLFPLERFLQMATNRAYLRHREKLDRLEPYMNLGFAINPTDLDWQALLTFQPEHTTLKLTRQPELAAQADVRVSAPLLVLLELLEGRSDGDAHFFSRDLLIEGNTEAILALRNTLDNAEVDFLAEITEIFGPLAAPLRSLLANARQRLRSQETMPSTLLDSASSQRPTPAPPPWPGQDENQGLYPS
ncbi:ubiquinone anaerobic biosynthesis accessory factor UbiT [Rhodovibrionaceae bacterium A322]